MNYSALIGKATKHSVSPVMYAEMVRSVGIAAGYSHIKVDVEPARLGAAVAALKELKFCGISVTQPHKLEVVKYLDELDEAVSVLGAVNTVRVGKTLKGYNTDWLGIAAPVRRAMGAKPARTATIFGTGGAARAAIYAAKQMGIAQVQVVHRNTPGGADRLAYLEAKQAELGISLHTYGDIAEVVERSGLVINATSAGMVGADAAPFDPDKLGGLNLAGKIYFEVVYNPLDTPLLRAFRDGGATTIDGLWMMIYQGVAALSIWLDATIELERGELERIHGLLEKELRNV